MVCPKVSVVQLNRKILKQFLNYPHADFPTNKYWLYYLKWLFCTIIPPKKKKILRSFAAIQTKPLVGISGP